jgi:ABC-type dipeptide/oligopeptide/nickel transport system permease component
MGILAVSAALIVLANLAADLAYGYLDPRIRYS